jgi:hypothetical protein
MPVSAVETGVEPIAARVRRLGRELAAALDEYAIEDGDQWKAHVWPQSVFPTGGAVWLQNLTADVSDVMRLFREWEATYVSANAGVPDDVCNSIMDGCDDIAQRMMALPSINAADFAAKYVVSTGYGDWYETGALMEEALRLTGSCRPHPKFAEA